MRSLSYNTKVRLTKAMMLRRISATTRRRILDSDPYISLLDRLRLWLATRRVSA